MTEEAEAAGNTTLWLPQPPLPLQPASADAIIAKFGVAAAAAAAMDGNLADNGVAIAHTVAVPKGLARCLKAEMSHSEGGRERVCIVFVLRNEIGEEALSGTAADEEEEEQVEHILQIHSH